MACNIARFHLYSAASFYRSPRQEAPSKVPPGGSEFMMLQGMLGWSDLTLRLQSKLSSLGAGLSLGLCGIVSLTPCRPTCYPSSPCPLSLEPVLPEPHPRATISGCQDSNGKSQQKSEGREQREAKVPLAAPTGSSQVGCVPQFEAMFLSR